MSFVETFGICYLQRIDGVLFIVHTVWQENVQAMSVRGEGGDCKGGEYISPCG